MRFVMLMKSDKPTEAGGTPAEAFIAGFISIEAKSLGEAIDWIKRWPALDGNGQVELQVRQVFGASQA
jgi:hypothetical protein